MGGELDERFGIERLTGHSRAFVRVIEQLRAIASTRTTVLIEGEAGTGKALVAQAIHGSSARRDQPFVRVHCGALADGVIEGELFGHEDGTAEAGARRGGFELAEGGTLFLDDIGAIGPAVQVKLLRAIQDRAFEHVGGGTTLKADVRLVAATHRDLEADVSAGRFRSDLWSRLSAVRIALPALRDRRDDIPLLAEAFLRELNREHGRRVSGITHGALERLVLHDWPGNVRELRNTLEGMVVFAEGRRALDLSDLPVSLRDRQPETERLDIRVGMTVDEAERQLIASTLRHCAGDKTRAAAILGIGLRTLYRKIHRYGIA